MKFVRKIDEQGFFIEDAFVKELDITTIETPCPQGFYRPKWSGEKWVEGLTQEEINLLKQPIETVESLKAQLEETDYKVIKCYEYQLAGLELPYDITELHTERQALRDKINELES